MTPPVRILVVEDEAHIAEVVQSYLEREGHMVSWAASGEDALDDFDRRRPDLVVLDLNLPGHLRRGRVPAHPRRLGRADHHAHGAGRRGGPRQGPRAGRRRLPHQALQPARADGARARPAAPGAQRRDAAGRRAGARRRAAGASTPPAVASPWTVRPVELTESEFRLLQTLARFPGRVYTRFELVEKVQGYEYEGYERTIDATSRTCGTSSGRTPAAPRSSRPCTAAATASRRIRR